MGICRRFFKRQTTPSDIRFKEREVSNGNTYEVYTAPTRSAAMGFLRQTEVREERRYVVVEVPQGTLAKDLVAIFDEGTQQVIEYGIRRALPSLTPSMSKCACCGYPVLPAGESIGESSAELLLTMEQLREKGVGFLCQYCRTLWCPFCVRLDPSSQPLCGICSKPLEVLFEGESPKSVRVFGDE